MMIDDDHSEPAGTGETILILAVGMRDGIDMEKAIAEVKPGALTRVVTEPRQLDGLQADEFVLTQEFSAQRSIRMLYGAQRTTNRVRTQKGL